MWRVRFVLSVQWRYLPILSPFLLSNARLHSVQGVMETGLFIGYCNVAYVGVKNGVKTMRRF